MKFISHKINQSMNMFMCVCNVCVSTNETVRLANIFHAMS